MPPSSTVLAEMNLSLVSYMCYKTFGSSPSSEVDKVFYVYVQ